MPVAKEAALRAVSRADAYVEEQFSADAIVEVATCAIALSICAAICVFQLRYRLQAAYAKVMKMEKEMAALRETAWLTANNEEGEPLFEEMDFEEARISAIGGSRTVQNLELSPGGPPEGAVLAADKQSSPTT